MINFKTGFDTMSAVKTVIVGTFVWSLMTGESVLGALHHIWPGKDNDDEAIGGVLNTLDRSSYLNSFIMMAGLVGLYSWIRKQ